MNSLNCYVAVEDLKYRLNIESGSDNPHWADVELLFRIRAAYRKAWMMLALKRGNWLGTDALVTASSGVITLPSDCGKILRVEQESNHEPIYIAPLQQARDYYPRLTSGFTETALAGSLHGNTIIMLESTYSEQVRIFYDRRYSDPICGTADSGSGTNSLILKMDDRPSLVDDTYNDITFAFMSGGAIGTYATASDYVGSTRTVTVAGDFNESTTYGTVFETPEEGNEAIVLDAAKNCASKPSSHLKDEYYRLIRSDAKAAWESFEEYIETRYKDNQNIGSL